ncbi:MAG: RNA polymerase sigma-70 factor [Arachidicoccus sp.]|nr:RNA polymerase sigma-70 factor [Arachidicoccus sp.]
MQLFSFEQGGIFFIDHFTHDTDNDLLEKWQQGNNRAFDALYKRHAVWLLELAVGRLNGNRVLAEDTLQEAMFRFYQHRDQLDAGLNVKNYLFIMVRNQVLNQIRTEQRYHDRQQVYANGMEDHIDDTANRTLLKEQEHLLHAQLQHLPEQCRRVFQLRRYENLSNKEIAETLGISVNTVEQHMRKALRILKEKLDYHLFLLLMAGAGMYVVV